MARVAFLLYEGVDELDFVSCYAPLAKAASLQHCPFDLVRIGGNGTTVCSAGLSINQLPPLCSDLETISHVLIPGGRGATAEIERLAQLALTTLRARGAPFYSVCSGALILARAGLLDGMRVAMHRGKTGQLLDLCRCKPVSGAIRDRWLYSVGGDVSSVRCKGLEAGFQVLRDVWPEGFAQIAGRMEYQPQVLES
jgi:AraC family transcriptional regulator, transcriptional activator FtrA